MKQRDPLHKSEIKTGKSRCALYTHIKNNAGHGIVWEQRSFKSTKRFLKKEHQTALHNNPLGDGTLMNPGIGIPINECYPD